MADRRWTRPLRKTTYGRASDPSTDDGSCSPVYFVIEGESASAAQTSVTLYHGTVALEPNAIGIPVPEDITLSTVSVSWLSDSDPGAAWTATLQVREPGGLAFTNAATFSVGTS